MITENRLPPQALDVERSTLAILIMNKKIRRDYYKIIPPDAFYMRAHRIIYSELQKMEEDSKIVDIVTLTNELRNSDKLDDIGTEVYLAEICESFETGYSIPEYFKILMENMISRDISDGISKINGLIYNESKTKPKDLILLLEELKVQAENNCDIAEIQRAKTGCIKSFNDYRDRVVEYKTSGFKNIGVSPGKEWEKFTELYRPAKGMLNIFTGIPGHGKSEFVDAIMINLAIEKGWKWAIFSPENWPLELHAQKLIEKITNQGFFELSAGEFERAYDFLNDHFKIIEPDEDNINVDSIFNLYRECIDKNNIDGCLLDPWNEMDNTPERNENLTNYIGRKLVKIRRFARNNNIYLVLVAHPQKMYRDHKTKKYNVPRLYDISDSANWFNKADNGLCVYRNFSDNTTDVHVQKIKFKIHGEVGCVRFTYDRKTGRYHEYDDMSFDENNQPESEQSELWQDKSFD